MKLVVPRPLQTSLRNLAAVVVFMLVVATSSTLAYMASGWSFPDALYMVVLTVWSVGYGEVRPINTPQLHALTVATIVFGCTGMIFLGGGAVRPFRLGAAHRSTSGRTA